MNFAEITSLSRRTHADPPLCADIGFAAVGIPVAQI